MSVDSSPIDRYLFWVGASFDPHAPLAIRIPVVMTNEMLALVRVVLRDFGQKIKCAENLENTMRSFFNFTRLKFKKRLA